MTFPEWDGYTAYEQHAAFTVPTAAWPAQIIPNTIFSGIAYRFPKLKWVFAETGIGAVSCAQTACDHEWERRRLWRHGLKQRPSEIIRQQVYVNFWYEQAGIGLRHEVGVDNIMWESDYPHIASTYPESLKFVDRSLQNVPRSSLADSPSRVASVREGVSSGPQQSGSQLEQFGLGADHVAAALVVVEERAVRLRAARHEVVEVLVKSLDAQLDLIGELLFDAHGVVNGPIAAQARCAEHLD